MSEYLLLNILVIALPFIMSFEKQIRFYKKFPALLVSYIIVGTSFIIWDAVAALRGDWSFNSEYLNGITLLYLPIEEILFFITVPYASIFLYETARVYLTERELKYASKYVWIASSLLILFSVLFYDKYYTFTVLVFSALFLIAGHLVPVSILKSVIYWKWLAFTYIPFFVVNYILTSLPIIEYSPDAIWGIRITTIPLEDFFYSFSLLSFNLLVYLWAKKKWIKE